MIKQDPQANLTDVYAFVGRKYNAPTTRVLNVIVNVRPFSEPGDGVTYDRFADDALYSIHIANPTTGALAATYNFRFSRVSSAGGGHKNLGTLLSYGLGTEAGPIIDIGDARQNFTQRYSVTRVLPAGTTTSLGSGLLCPPPNVGRRTTPYYNDFTTGKAISGASTESGLDRYTRQGVHSLPGGEVVFCGPREDGFYADTPGIFDLLDGRILGDPPTSLGQSGGGVDGFKGYNVLTYAIQIPISALPSFSYSDAFTGTATGVGVYASVSRQRIRLLSTAADPTSSGPWIQINRLGNPLFNEVLVALRDKDNYNRDLPTSDVTKYRTYALNPEIALLVNAIYLTSLPATGRTDLARVFIPDVLRVATGTDPVPLAGQIGFSRLSGLGADTTGGKWSGWPNGRRLGDDVVDIALTAVASGPTYSSIVLVGDNVAANDQLYHQVFPYAATPHSGTANSKDPDGP